MTLTRFGTFELCQKPCRQINLILLRPFFHVLCGWEIWSLTLREECRLRVSEDRVLRRIFGPKRDEIKGKWKLENTA
jgi:hypothetical protein